MILCRAIAMTVDMDVAIDMGNMLVGGEAFPSIDIRGRYGP
jgi:hypothetical protein